MAVATKFTKKPRDAVEVKFALQTPVREMLLVKAILASKYPSDIADINRALDNLKIPPEVINKEYRRMLRDYKVVKNWRTTSLNGFTSSTMVSALSKENGDLYFERYVQAVYSDENRKVIAYYQLTNQSKNKLVDSLTSNFESFQEICENLHQRVVEAAIRAKKIVEAERLKVDLKVKSQANKPKDLKSKVFRKIVGKTVTPEEGGGKTVAPKSNEGGIKDYARLVYVVQRIGKEQIRNLLNNEEMTSLLEISNRIGKNKVLEFVNFLE